MVEELFDYIVVGAGSAGCVLAGRLSEDPATRVLLLEAGPPNRSPWIHLPIGYTKTMWSDKLNWRFHTDPDPNMNGRRIYWPRGKTLGGSSSINGMIYTRGQREDYDHWAALGNIGWSYLDVLPYFVKSEGNQRGFSVMHSGLGPLKVSDVGRKHELIEAFIQGAGQIGASSVPPTDDFNGVYQEGAGYYQLTTHKGWRWSAADAYLKPARRRRNLRIETGAFAAGVVMEGTRAVGVRYRQGGTMKTARCRGEVLLAAGAVQSPQLLQLSGIGPRAMLERHGIATLVDSPGVGENLQDHLQIRLTFECTRRITTNDQLNSWGGRLAMGLQWLLYRSGPLAISPRPAASCAHCTAGTTGPQRARPTCSSTSRLRRPRPSAARCIRTRASRCRCASCGPSRAATYASARPIRSSPPRSTPTTWRPNSIAAPQWPA